MKTCKRLAGLGNIGAAAACLAPFCAFVQSREQLVDRLQIDLDECARLVYFRDRGDRVGDDHRIRVGKQIVETLDKAESRLHVSLSHFHSPHP